MQPEQIRVRRGGDEGPPESSVRPPKSTSIPWRNVVLIAAPFLFSIGNLVEARFEKQSAIVKGNNEYARLQGEGEIAKKVAIETGYSVGKSNFLTPVNAAEKKRAEALPTYQTQADGQRTQGEVKGALAASQANVQHVLFGPLYRIYMISLALARIEAERDHGILLRINDANESAPVEKYPITKIEFIGRSLPNPQRLKELDQEKEKLDKEEPAVAAALREGPSALARERSFSVPSLCEDKKVPFAGAK